MALRTGVAKQDIEDPACVTGVFEELASSPPKPLINIGLAIRAVSGMEMADTKFRTRWHSGNPPADDAINQIGVNTIRASAVLVYTSGACPQ